MTKLKIPPKTLKLLRVVSQVALDRGERAFAVGGFVRDLLQGRHNVDVDIAVLGDGVAFAEDLAKALKGRTEAYTQFGTSIVVSKAFGKVDVATARSESYDKPGALPTVQPGDIGQDLARRDFTINSMALSLDPFDSHPLSTKTRGGDRSLRAGPCLKLIDPYGGQEDLKRGLVRAHHHESFTDDPTRIFRAVRFEQRYGKQIERQTEAWLYEALARGCCGTVSGERIRNELRLLFAEPHPEKAVRRLAQIGVLKHLHPKLGLRDGDGEILARTPDALRMFRRLGKTLDEEWMVWFQALMGDLTASGAQTLCERLMLSRAERKVAQQRVTLGKKARARLHGGRLPYSHIHRILAPLMPEVQCFLTASMRPDARRRVEAYYRRENALKPWVRGRELQKLGIPPGFQYSFILQQAYERQLDGEFKSKRQALGWVKERFGQTS